MVLSNEVSHSDMHYVQIYCNPSSKVNKQQENLKRVMVRNGICDESAYGLNSRKSITLSAVPYAPLLVF